MKIHEATEQAYKNGYEDGYKNGYAIGDAFGYEKGFEEGFEEGKQDAVKHGRWISASNKPGVYIGLKCSLCGARIKYSEFHNGNHKYCHKCGAKMDGDGNG
jgi:hypothetical protein